MWCDTKCKRVRKGWNRRREWERQRARRGLNGWEHTLGCYSAGIRFHTYPRGSDRFTNGHGDNWSLQYYWNAWHQAARQTHTHTLTYIYILYMKTHTLIYSPYTIYACIQPHTSVQQKNKRKAHCAVSECTLRIQTHVRGIGKAIKHFLVAGRFHLGAICT